MGLSGLASTTTQRPFAPDQKRKSANWRRLMVASAFCSAMLGWLPATYAASGAPYFVVNNFEIGQGVTPSVQSALANDNAAGLVFTLPWSGVQPDCQGFTFPTDAKSAFGYLAANLRSDQTIIPGIRGGATAPACLAQLGIPFVPIYYAFGKHEGNPCQLLQLPLMSSPDYAQTYVAAVDAMLKALADIQVASGGTLASRVVGVNLGAYAAETAELRIASTGCTVKPIHDTAKAQAKRWADAGYTSADALSTYASIVTQIAADPALPSSAILLQNVLSGDRVSFPHYKGWSPVLQPLLSDALTSLGDRFVISWDLVSETGALPPADVITAAASGTPLALQFNGTAGGITSCGGVLKNGHFDRKPATPKCFHEMQPRNVHAIPPESHLVLWQVEPDDFGVKGYFPK